MIRQNLLSKIDSIYNMVQKDESYNAISYP